MRCSRWLRNNPFTVLQLSPSATREEVKLKYRELAKKHHPDNPGGDRRVMEQLNKAYNTLIKEGGYDKLHVPKGASSDARDFYANLSKLDLDTERATPTGGFTYRNSESGRWQTVDEPLKNNKPRYATYGHEQYRREVDLAADIRQRSMDSEIKKQTEEKAKPWIQRSVLEPLFGSWLPDRPTFLILSSLLYFTALLISYFKGAEFQMKWDAKLYLYGGLRARRAKVDEVYPYFKDEMHATAVIAAATYLAACAGKSLDDPVVPPRPNPLLADPTPEFYKVMCGA
jgi:hypothetical protein